MNITGPQFVTQLSSKVVRVDNNTEGSLMDMVVTTVGIIIAMALLSCICCLCMKLSDLRLKAWVLEKAKKKGIPVDLEIVESKCRCGSPLANENCTIMVPDVGFIL